MGLTQHRGAVATIQEITNLLLLRGNIGKFGAGLCPVRGHSNVQGDRTMGVWEKAHDSLLDGLRDEFGFEPNREHGLDSVDTLRAMHDGRVRVFFAVGRQLRRGHPRHHPHGGGDARPRPHRARLDQAQPLPRRHRQ